jgi:hypothetical protein
VSGQDIAQIVIAISMIGLVVLAYIAGRIH